MFTDIVGYSRLMEENEQRTMDIIAAHNRIVFPVLAAANGEVIDAIGDGLLVIFPSVVEAVKCGLSVHDAIAEYNDSVSRENRFELRIGVHLGEIWQEDDRVFGNGVNVAARVQPFAQPGGICITEDVLRQITNKVGAPTTSIGRKQLRNISRGYELYRVATGFEQKESEMPQGTAAFDEIKEKLIVERQKVSQQHRERSATRDDEDSLGQRIENRVFNLVERAMDTAIDKWDQMPEEKREKALKEIRAEIHVGGKTKKKHHEDEEDENNPASIAKRIGIGVVFGAGFGIGFFAFGVSWMVWPFAILGVLPFASGVGKGLLLWAKNKGAARKRPQELEGTILRAARKVGGRVTVVQIAAETDLPLDEVQTVLDSMTAKGYVAQEVLDTGVIRYDFPALLGTDTGGAPIT